MVVVKPNPKPIPNVIPRLRLGAGFKLGLGLDGSNFTSSRM